MERPLNHGNLTWNDRRLDGRRRQLDKNLSRSMGERARSGLDAVAETNTASLNNPDNKQQTKDRASINLRNIDSLKNLDDLQDRPTTINDIANRYEDKFLQSVDKGTEIGTASYGSGFYYDHNRMTTASIDQSSGLTNRQVAAINAVNSATKNPDHERRTVTGITHLAGSMSERQLGGVNIGSIEPDILANVAANIAAKESALEQPKDRIWAPNELKMDVDLDKAKVDDPELYDQLRNAGLSHTDNVAKGIRIARGEESPSDAFNPVTTPKTGNYAEIIAQSRPGSLEEADYRNISRHFQLSRAGEADPNQGMFMFSQENEGDKLSYDLRPDTPTVIDTWMIAAGSGQPDVMYPNYQSEDKPGKAYPAAKRLVDEGFPLSPTSPTKKDLGVDDLRDASLSSQNIVSAQYGEAINRVSKRIGAISYNQFGEEIRLPSTMIQEGIWGIERYHSNKDSDLNEIERERAASAKNEADILEDQAHYKNATQRNLFEKQGPQNARFRSRMNRKEENREPKPLTPKMELELEDKKAKQDEEYKQLGLF